MHAFIHILLSLLFYDGNNNNLNGRVCVCIALGKSDVNYYIDDEKNKYHPLLRMYIYYILYISTRIFIALPTHTRSYIFTINDQINEIKTESF